MFPWIAIGLLVLIILLSYVLKWQRGRSISHLPTYTYLPGFGTMYKLLGGGKALHDEVMVVSEIMDETNLPFIYWAGSNPIIILQDPEDLKLVTNAFIEKPSLYNFAKVWLGESVATTTGREWKHDVKGFTKALKRRSVKNYQDVFNTQAKKLVNKLKSGESSNIFSDLTYTTFEAICKICTGDSEIPDLIPVQEYHEAISSVLEGVITRMTNILYHPEFLFQRTQTYRDLKKNTAVLHNVSKKMFPWIAIGLLVLIILLSYVLKWQRGRSISHLPTYTYLPGFGTMYKLLGGGKALHDEVMVVSEIMDETNLPFIYWAGSNPIIILQDPEDLKLVTNAFIEKPSLYNFAKVWLGESVATTTGREWKHDVKGFTKALKRRSVKNYQDVFNTQAKKLVNKLKSGESSNIFSDLTYTTFEAICKICTGDSEIPDLIPVQEYHEAISSVLEGVITRMTNILYHPEFLFQRTQTYRDLKKNIAVLHNVSKKLLERYKQNQLAEKNENRDGKGTRAKYKPFLSHFVDIGLSDERIKSEIDILIFAQDPVATALLMIFIIIGTRQDIQDKLYNEIKGIFGDSKRDVVNEDMEKMVYCEGVIRETLRLYPPGPMALRKIDAEFKIPSCTIPKDTICLINIWGSGRSKSLWGPDVLKFKPERWIDPDSLPPILAFSSGKRGCVGEKYAYPMLKTLVAHAVRELTFEADLTKIKIKAEMVLKVYEGLETLKISKREATENTKEKKNTKEIYQTIEID